MALLIDIGACCEAHTNDALEHLHKAIGEGDPDAIWRPHNSPFISRLIELFTERGLLRLEGFRLELDKWLAGEMHVGAHRPPRPAGMMERWTPSEQALVRLYLEAIPPGSFTLDDYMLCVDYLTQRYLPADQLKAEADWLATRSVLMGRVQASMAEVTARQSDTLLEAMPASAAAAVSEFAFTPVQAAILEYAVARGCENVVEIASTTRHAMKVLIQRKMADDALGVRTPAGALQTQLFDRFGELNRDWRRIALTEAAENSNQGYVASLAPGTFVRRLERYKGACPFCKRIDGRVMKVVAAGDPDADGETCIWPGKTNIGRSASPRQRQAGMLIERQPEEMWWVAAGVQHPHCRGSWQPEIVDLPGEDTEFGAWIRKTLREKKV